MYTAEQVTPGHPDKVCDHISDAIVDMYVSQDPKSRVAAEVFASGNTIVVGGEVTSEAQNVDIEQTVKNTLKKIGYVQPWYDVENCQIQNILNKQSPDIAQGVAGNDGNKEEIGAGDQGIMFGYATNENDVMLPEAYRLANQLATNLFNFTSGNDKFGPDGKVQITLDANKQVANVIVSNQHSDDLTIEQVRQILKDNVITPTLGELNVPLHINATGKFVLGGPAADAGLTGRKIIADNYGPGRAVGGGAFSGKDATKVDRSAAYMARYVAKHIVTAGLASRCQVMVAYSIGVAQPTDFFVNTFGTGNDQEITAKAKEIFSLTPAGIIDHLALRQPIYSRTSGLGHFTKDDLPWEKIDEHLLNQLR